VTSTDGRSLRTLRAVSNSILPNARIRRSQVRQLHIDSQCGHSLRNLANTSWCDAHTRHVFAPAVATARAPCLQETAYLLGVTLAPYGVVRARLLNPVVMRVSC
jgi:hypothetical protein